MAEATDKITEALREIWCGRLEIIIEKGQVVCIPAQTIQRPGERAGVLTQHTIREDISR
jgi:hypothetical protein